MSPLSALNAVFTLTLVSSASISMPREATNLPINQQNLVLIDNFNLGQNERGLIEVGNSSGRANLLY